MVVVPKKDSQEPRITVDLTALNKFVERPAYPVRPPQDAVAAISKNMTFLRSLILATAIGKCLWMNIVQL